MPDLKIQIVQSYKDMHGVTVEGLDEDQWTLSAMTSQSKIWWLWLGAWKAYGEVGISL